ncbi:short chain dehydrogenase reductase family [Colletotrichum truncatum]|uniref:Short chain dehydrogenase reductase family n=1 Tax=Colletotrichum truncatum TaxID=5467 RepID=A0ACC3Z8X1_COLTU|nr:short chain dehydrogenase reductase family [Colletotrichum truncatum]KAF6789265.1 short chain dehydrogenase reductase family [Colletotrichum truncatum]
MGLEGKNVLVTGASMGIGEAIATALAAKGANLVLLSRSERNLATLANKLSLSYSNIKIIYRAADVGDFESVDKAIASAIEAVGQIDILVNNAGLALGAPASFPELKIQDIMTMANTNVNGMMFVTHSVLNRSMMTRKPGEGTILNITSVTGLEVPPFSGEAVYHASKAFQEAFTNSIRNELVNTNIKVLALRPGVVATNFHSLRVGHDKEKYDSFIEGYDPLVSEDVAQAAIYMLDQPPNISIKALDVVPTAQRSLTVFDRTWAERDH